MSKRIEYREKVWKEYISSEESYGAEEDDLFEKGFDTVVALDLPILFSVWYEDLMIKCNSKPDIVYESLGKNLSSKKDFYEYWVEKIFKIE